MKGMPQAAVAATGVANTASVLAALVRAGANPELTEDPARIEKADFAVLPGVGAFAAGMARLRETGAGEAIRARVRAGRPTLAVCLGLQLLFETSEESPGETGLCLVRGAVRRFPDTVRVPQLGWNKVEPEAGCLLVKPGYAYFANSYRVEQPPPEWMCAFTDYAGRFAAALEQGPILCCQFHPELSGAWGTELLVRWLAAGKAG